MTLLGRITIGLLTLVVGATSAQAQGWAPLYSPFEAGSSAVASSYGTYAVPASAGLVTVYASGQPGGALALPPAGWAMPACRPLAGAPPAPYVGTFAPVPATYRPAVTVNYVQPTVTYSPAPTVAYLPTGYAAQPVAVGRRVWVKPKVYVEGQPVRNFLRAITP